MNETISIKEAMMRIVRELEEINVPVKYALQIARPLDEAVRHLYDCINAYEEDEEQGEKQEGGEENVQL